MAEKLVARTGFQYAGKFLKAGDVFETLSASDALILKATKKARPAPETEPERRAKRARMPQWEAPPPAPLVEEPEQQTDELPAAEPEPAEDHPPMSDPEPRSVESELIMQGLRERAEALGITVDGRWGERRLRQEIAAVSSSARYNRRDLRAEE